MENTVSSLRRNNSWCRKNSTVQLLLQDRERNGFYHRGFAVNASSVSIPSLQIQPGSGIIHTGNSFLTLPQTSTSVITIEDEEEDEQAHDNPNQFIDVETDSLVNQCNDQQIQNPALKPKRLHVGPKQAPQNRFSARLYLKRYLINQDQVSGEEPSKTSPSMDVAKPNEKDFVSSTDCSKRQRRSKSGKSNGISKSCLPVCSLTENAGRQHRKINGQSLVETSDKTLVHPSTTSSTPRICRSNRLIHKALNKSGQSKNATKQAPKNTPKSRLNRFHAEKDNKQKKKRAKQSKMEQRTEENFQTDQMVVSPATIFDSLVTSFNEKEQNGRVLMNLKKVVSSTNDEQDDDNDSSWITPIIVKVEHIDPDDIYQTPILQSPNNSLLSPSPSSEVLQFSTTNQQPKEQVYSFMNDEEQEISMIQHSNMEYGDDPLAFS